MTDEQNELRDSIELLLQPWKPLPVFEKAEFNPAWLDDPKLHCIREMVEAVSQAVGVNYTMPGMAALGAMSAACCGKFTVKGGYEQPAALWLWMIGKSGAGKSPSITPFAAPLLDWQLEENQRRKTQAAMDQAERDTLEAEKKKAIASGKVNEAKEAAAKLENLPPKTELLHKFQTGNITPEALRKIFPGNGNCAAIIDKDAQVFQMAQGQYSERPDISTFMLAWDGSNLSTARANGETFSAETSALSILSATQPVIAEEVLENKNLVQCGFVARFLIGYGEEGNRPALIDRKPVDEAISNDYKSHMRYVCSLPNRVIEFESEALQLVSDYTKGTENEWKPLEEFAGKYEQNTIRICGILAACKLHSKVTVADAEDACCIMDFFRNQIYAVRGMKAGLSQDASAVLDYITEKGIEFRLQSEITNYLRKVDPFKKKTASGKAKRINAAVNELVSAGYAQLVKISKPGEKPSYVFVTNPELL